jgi:tetratricopeptide (TPR) repeat protein
VTVHETDVTPMPPADERGSRRPASLFSIQQVLVVCLLLVANGDMPTAQTRPGQPPATPAAAAPADPATRALNAGEYDAVEALLRNDSSPRAIALRARAHIARGRYAEAEKLLAPAVASAPLSDAALELGRLHMLLGRRADGRRILTRIVETLQPRTSADVMRLALASRELGDFKSANSFFQQANRMSPGDPQVNTAWGELFLEKYDPANAMKSFEEALGADESNVAARIGVARVALDRNPPAAQAAIESVLKTNPNYVPAHLLTAEMALDERRRDDAKESIAKALAVNPASLEARALDATIAFLEARDADFNRKAEDILKINPVYGEVYRIAGDHAARNYRFDEAAELVRRALKVDPESARSYGDLGVHLLRTGDEPGARQALERAFKDDPYDQVTYNLLTMLDKVDKFETVQEGNITIRLAPEEAAVMREQVMPLAKEALAELAKRWNYTVTGPILIEMFPVHDDFAVRNVGLPGMIGALGACFGRVVTLDSPHARPPGEYNWEPTLWHELAHVVTLQMSNNRVPRWLTEGISVWEEKRARPEWGREMELSFAHALDQNKTLKLDVLNEGFSDPKMISLAYYEASLLAEHLYDTYGAEGLSKLLRAYGRGLETDAALKEAFNASMDDLQVSFDARLVKQYAGLRSALKRPQLEGTPSADELKKLAVENPGSFPVQVSLAQALAQAGDKAGAIQALERAAQLIPSATGDDNPNKAIAKLALDSGDNARAIRALETVVRVDHADVESARKLASLVAASGDAARADDAYRRLAAVDPFDAQAQAAIGRYALLRKDAATAVRALRTALATNPADRASAHTDLAEAYVLANRPVEAKQQALAALEIAPSFERAQDLLLKIRDGSSGAAAK